jgi:hypothetical protein
MAFSARGASLASRAISRETTGSQATGPNTRLAAQHRHIRKAVPAQRQRHRQIGRQPSGRPIAVIFHGV